MGEGREVRLAYDGPSFDHDGLISEIERIAREEHSRSSDASESAAKTAEFIEETGINSQALSWLKAIVKKLPKKDGQAKAMDIIRSLEAGLPMVRAHVEGQGTAEMFPDEPEEEAPTGVDDNPDDAETAEFNAEVDKVVQPIDFSRSAE
jgi:hypothetical protein